MVRILVLLLAIVGALGGASLGSTWISDADKYLDSIAEMEKLGQSTKSAAIQENFSKLKSLVNTGWLLICAGIVGIGIGIAVVLKKLPAIPAGIGLLGCWLVPGIFFFASIFFSIGFLAAGVLCLWKLRGVMPPTLSTNS